MDDAYLRLHTTSVRLASNIPAHPGSLVFIDIEPPSADSSKDDIVGVMKKVSNAPPGFFLHASIVLIRWPTIFGIDGTLEAVAEQFGDGSDGSDDDLVEQAKSVKGLISSQPSRRLRVGIVVFPMGEEPRIVWADELGGVHSDRELLARARTAEVSALLERGKGVWQPSGYHYCLPSGEHSSTFVRLADAFRSPRDPVALATWLHQEIREGLGIVSDTPTLLPLISAIELVAVRCGLSSPHSVMLSDYSSNHFEIEHALGRVEGSERILGVVSVSSTGTTAHRIADALREKQYPFALETLISRRVPPADELDGPDAEIRRPWYGIPDNGEVFANADVCLLCREKEPAPVVSIDPNGFQPMVLPLPDLMTPAVRKAEKCQELWQYYDRTREVGINAQPHPTTSEFRSGRKSLAVRCYPHWLLDKSRYEDIQGESMTGEGMYEDFLEKVQARVRSISAGIFKGESPNDPEGEFRPAAIDVVVVTKEDHDSPGFTEFLEAVCEGFDVDTFPSVVAVDRPHTELGGHIDQLRNKSNVLVLSLGSITGTTMQQLLLAIHTVLPELGSDPSPQIAGLVMHARMEDDREWAVLQNAYTRLHAIWSTPLPLSSPFDAEAQLTNLFAVEASATCEFEFYQGRRAFLNALDGDWESRIEEGGAEVDPWAVFWGMQLNSTGGGSWRGKDYPRLRPGSLYGHRLRASSTFAAVGSAVQIARLDKGSAPSPVRLQFEMPAILRSYFDAPIIASILRWVEPHETWWGNRYSDASNVLAEALARADPNDKKLLLSEFLLASAQGKVPKSGTDWLKSQAVHYIWCWENSHIVDDGDISWSDEEIAPVKLGLDMLRKDHSFTGDHFSYTKDRLSRASDLLDSWQGDETEKRSLVTAQLMWALDSFLESG